MLSNSKALNRLRDLFRFVLRRNAASNTQSFAYRSPATARAEMESLEDRLLLSVSFTPHDIVNSSSGSDSADGVYAVAVADFDGDGDKDIASNSLYDNTLAWYENDGGESFTVHTITTSNLFNYDLSAADVDSDGDMDLLASDADQGLSWYENDGAGNFTRRAIAGTTRPDRYQFGDIDGDGDIDIVAAFGMSNTVKLLLNDGSENFSASTIATIASVTSIYFEDIDDDGNVDVVISSYDDDTVSWLENDGAENFTRHIIRTAPTNVRDAYPVDLDEDGDMDIVAALYGYDYNVDNPIEWYENDGAESFTVRTVATAQDDVFAVHVADIDGDGDLDVAAGSYYDDTIAWYANDGSENFTQNIVVTDAAEVFDLVLNDLDDDGDIDIISAEFDSDTVAWYESGATPDVTSPSIVDDSVPADGTYHFGEDLDFTVSWDEGVVVTGTPRLTLTVGGSTVYADYASGSGTAVLTFTYTIAEDDVDVDGIAVANAIDLNGGTLKDDADNDAAATASFASTAGVLVEATIPSITGDTVPADGWNTTGDDLSFTVTWDENITVTGTPRLTLTIGSSTVYADYASGSGGDTLTFTYTVQAGDNDTDGIAVANAIDLNGGTLQDDAGNDAAATASFASTAGVLVDTTAASVTGDTVPADGSYAAGEGLSFTVTWDENVTVTGTPRLTLTIGGSTVYADYASGSGGDTLTFTYTVQAGDNDSDGIAAENAIDLNGGTLKDDAGNDAAATASFASTAGVLVDTTAASVTGDTVPADGSYAAGGDLSFTVTWDESVTVAGTPRLTLTIGGSTVYADYASGSGGDTLTFTYTVQAGDNDADGIAVANAIDLNGGTIKDAADINAATVAAFASTAGVLVDTTAASITGQTVPADGSYATGDDLSFTVTWDENVTVTGTPRLALTIGGSTVYADYASGSGGDTLTFTYTVQAGDNDADGIAVANAIDLNGGTLKDAADNNAAATASFASTAGVLVDAVAPVVDSLSPAHGATGVALDASLVVTFTKNVLIADADGITLYRYVDGVSDVETSASVSVNGMEVTIDPDANLELAGTYYVEIAADAVTDELGNPFAGMSGTGDWSFEALSDSTPPTVDVDQTTLVTKDDTPTISGTCSADTALITVQVGGTTYRSDAVGEVTLDSTTWTLTLADTAEGTYAVTVTATDAAENPATANMTLIIAESDQPAQGETGEDTDAIVSRRGRTIATYTDHDGDTVKIVLSGGGTFDLLLTEDVSEGAVAGAETLQAVVMSDTTDRSRLVIAVNPDRTLGSDGLAEVGYISALAGDTSDGSVRGIFARDASLTGTLTLAGGAHRVVFDNVSGDVSADWIGGFFCMGDMTGSMTLSGADTTGVSLGSLVVSGTMQDSAVSTAGSIRRVRVGAMSGSDILAGMDADVARHASDNADFAAQCAVGNVRIGGLAGGGDCFVDSNISAADIGMVNLINPAFDNGGTDFGIWAQNSLRRVSWRNTTDNSRGRWDGLTEGNIQDDFCIDLLEAVG